MKRFAAALGIMLAGAGNAHAFCSEPYGRFSAPSAPGRFDRPDVPYCLSSYKWSGKHECDSWEIDSYKREVEEHIEKLNSFVSEANALSQQASRFAREAYDYARCEADEISNQHQ